MTPRTIALLVAAALALPLAGCGGGSAVGAGKGRLVFAPGASAPKSLELAGPSSAVAPGSTFVVEVRSPAGLTDLYGGGFDLRYDRALLEFVSADTAGSPLTNAIDRVALRNGRPGAVVFARTKEGQVPGDSVQGRIASFTFKALAAGRSRIDMTDLALVDGAGADMTVPPASGIEVTAQ